MTELIAVLGGFAIGVVGTLIGAGGGFILVPLLVLFEPHWSVDEVTAFSLAVVAANATTGALSYWRQGRVDPFSFPLYTVAAIPGSILGAFATAFIPRRAFDPLFGAVLIGIGIWLFVRPGTTDEGAHTGPFRRILFDRSGHRYEWWFDPRIGFVGSAFVGFFSSVLGIGGGIIHVPLLATILGFPAHVATATSHAVLAVTAAIGTLVHLARGDYRSTWPLVVGTAAGAVAGAPVGALLSTRVPGAAILRILAVALGFVGIRLLVAR